MATSSLPRVRAGAGVWRPTQGGKSWDELFLLAKVSGLRWVAAEGGTGALVLMDLGQGVRFTPPPGQTELRKCDWARDMAALVAEAEALAEAAREGSFPEGGGVVQAASSWGGSPGFMGTGSTEAPEFGSPSFADTAEMDRLREELERAEQRERVAKKAQNDACRKAMQNLLNSEGSLYLRVLLSGWASWTQWVKEERIREQQRQANAVDLEAQRQAIEQEMEKKAEERARQAKIETIRWSMQNLSNAGDSLHQRMVLTAWHEEAKNEKHRKEKEAIQVEKEVAEESAKRMSATAQTLRQGSIELQTQYSAAEEQVLALTAERDELLKDLANQHDRRAELRDRFQKARDDKGELRRTLEEEEAKRVELENRVALLAQEEQEKRVALEGRIQMLEESSRRIEEESRRIEAEKMEQTARLDAVEGQREALQQELNRVESELSTMLSHVRPLATESSPGQGSGSPYDRTQQCFGSPGGPLQAMDNSAQRKLEGSLGKD